MEKSVHNFKIENLGKRTITSAIETSYFVPDSKRILFNKYLNRADPTKSGGRFSSSIEVAGPRKSIYFEPKKVKAAIITCGGLSPGINDVIRSLVMELHHHYSVKRVYGIKYGFRGLVPEYEHNVMFLTPDVVKDIHTVGGSILSSSRGGQDISKMVDAIDGLGVNMFFCIGGDGTMRATKLITEEITRRDLKISVIGIPKTIDNDLNMIDRTFGFDTAFSEVVKVIQCAHVEAEGAPMGIGLVKIMGRESGHIALSATLAQSDVNFVLIPELPFDLKGEKGFLRALEKRLKKRGHAVVLVAEGAGQDLCSMGEPLLADASGNKKLYDIGTYLKNNIEEHFKGKKIDVNLKYIDPSYIIRSVPANASDSLYCELLGQYAVHAGMAGKTGMVVGLFNNEYVHFPLGEVTSRRKVDTKGSMLMRALEATGQPQSMKN